MPRAAANTNKDATTSAISTSGRRSRRSRGGGGGGDDGGGAGTSASSSLSATAVIAPGGGTARDIADLGRKLGLNSDAVGAIMNARGRGMRRGGGAAAAAAAAAADGGAGATGGSSVKGANAWADFMSEEMGGASGLLAALGGGGGDDEGGAGVGEPESKRARTGGAGAAGAAAAASAARASLSLSSSSSVAAVAAPADGTPRSYVLPIRPRIRPTDDFGGGGNYDGDDDDDNDNNGKTMHGPPIPGRLAQTGTLDVAFVGRSKRPLTSANAFDLAEPTLLFSRSVFQGVKIAYVATSSSSCHSIAIDVHGVPYGWGRNENHQLGSIGGGGGRSVAASSSAAAAAAAEGGAAGGCMCVPIPTRLEGPWEDAPIIGAATGKGHTILIEGSGGGDGGEGGGRAYSIGNNKTGQCGVNHATDEVRSWRRCVLAGDAGTVAKGKKLRGGTDSIEVVHASCGDNFSVLLTSQGHIYSAGLSEFGQLGNGATGEHFISANKIAFANASKFERRPLFVQGEADAITTFAAETDVKKGKTIPMEDSADIVIGSVACGRNHTVAVEARSASGHPSRVFTWGCGGYGVLGHGVQADEYMPRLVATLRGPLFAANSPVRAVAGAQCSMVLTANGHVYYWGRHRAVGEATMRPTLVDVLVNNGHIVTALGGGFQTVFCATTNGSTVSWGNGPHGELGYGMHASRSSAKPKFVERLDQCLVTDLACGYGHTLFLIRDEDEEDKKALAKVPAVEREDVADFVAAAAGMTVAVGKGRKKK